MLSDLIHNREALLAQSLMRDVQFATPASAAEDKAFAELFLSYELVFRKTLRRGPGWRTRIGKLASMKTRLVRAEAGDFAELREDILKTDTERTEIEAKAKTRTAKRDAATEKGRLIRRAQRLASIPLYSRATSPRPFFKAHLQYLLGER